MQEGSGSPDGAAGADVRPGPQCTIRWHDGPRDALRPLFELADDSAAQLDAYVEQGRVLVARDARGRTLGHLQLLATPLAGVVEIKSLAVDERCRRLGIGRRLVEHALAVCRSEGATAVTLITAAADIDNLRFYQRLGFRPSAVERDAFTPATGYRAGLEADGIPVRDAIRFTIELPPRG